MALISWPFVGAEALSRGAIPERAMRTQFEPVYPGIFVPRGIELSAEQRAKAAWLWSGRRGVVAGQSAAAMLGSKWIDGSEPGELIHDNRKSPKHLVVRDEALAVDESFVAGAMRLTTAARTAFDLGRHTASRVRSVQRLDALANATGLTADDVEAVAAAHRGVRGIRRLRSVLPLIDGGAESPQETVARLALVDAGLPAPQTQVNVFGDYGEFIARVDMAYEEVRVGIEYDGPQHWDDYATRQRDIDKQIAFADARWHIIRVGRDLLKYRRPTYVHRVASALRDRGLTW